MCTTPKKPHPSAVTLRLLRLATTTLLSVSIDSPTLDISCQWNYIGCVVFCVWLLSLSVCFYFFNWFLESERKGKREKRHQFVVPLTDAFIGCFFYVPSPGIEPVALVYWDDAPTNWATWAGPLGKVHLCCSMSSPLSIVEWHSIVWVYRILFIIHQKTITHLHAGI